MDQLALYRKYRPTKFAEVLGQNQVISVLAGAIKQGQVAHAYLLAGPRGTGKTSVARIFANELATSPNDLYEIDAASNRGVDEIRELRAAVATLPFDSKYKVYIVDEVHMLTREAFNALLKTLEEPPAHVIFVLATTEIHKLPETIISRCQTLSFRPPAIELVATVIKRISRAEGRTIDEEAINLIALLGDGSFRDAIGVLQQVMSVAPAQKIGLAEVEAVTAAPRRQSVEQFLTAATNGDLAGGLAAVRQAVKQNYDFKIWVKLILQQLRLALLLKFAPNLKTELLADLSANELKFLTALANSPKANLLPELLRQLLAVYDELGRSTLPELPLELVLVRLFGQPEEVVNK